MTILLTAKVVLLSSWALKPSQPFQLKTKTPSSPILISHPSSCLLMAINHDYERDTSVDTSRVDVDAVNELLGERLHARKTGDFDVADKIRDRLSSEYRVTVFDQDKMWTTGEGATNRGGRSGRGGVRGGRGGRGRGGRGRGGRGGMNRGSRDFRSNFGPNGHDYELCSQAGPNSSRMTEAAIHRMVAERLMAKMNRDFVRADKVQLELAEEGIFVNDKTKEWRADGVRFIAERRPPSDRNRPYVQSRHSQSLPENSKFTLEQIEQLVASRWQCKQDRKFNKADTIRDALEQNHDVVIDDRIREWSIGGSFGRDADIKRAHNEALKARSYAMSSASLALLDGVTQNNVQDRVDARMRARTNHNYQESDALRDELLEEFDVVINDKLKMWSVGGDFGLDDPVKALAQKRGYYTRRGGGNLSEGDVVLIQDMLRERFEAKRHRNFDVADEIRSHLYEQYNVNVDDDTSEWRVLSDDYIQTKAERGAKELDVDDASVVDSQLQKRIILKKNKNYEEADAIRDNLQDGYSILIDDKKKEWKVVSKSKFPYKKKRIVAKDQVEHDPWFDSDNDDTTTVVIDTDTQIQNTSSPTVMSKNELLSLTVPSLKDKLREVGKPVSGKKADLIDRLLA